MKVSVIVPTVGRPSVENAVASISSQTNVETEPIVVLDNPKEESFVRALLANLHCKILVTDRQGAAAARNKGLAAATGEYIGYLDDDDTWMPQKLDIQLKALNALEGTSRVCAVLSEFVRSDGRVIRTRPPVFSPTQQHFSSYLLDRTRMRHGSVYFSTPTIIGDSDLMKSCQWNDTLRKHQDWDMLMRLMSTPGLKTVYVDQHLVSVNQGSQGSLSKQSDWNAGRAFFELHGRSLPARTRADFVYGHWLLHAIRARSISGTLSGFRAVGLRMPHFAALFRTIVGIVLGR